MYERVEANRATVGGPVVAIERCVVRPPQQVIAMWQIIFSTLFDTAAVIAL